KLSRLARLRDVVPTPTPEASPAEVRLQGLFPKVSYRNRNVRHFTAIRMSAVRGLSLLPLERPPPRVIRGWTAAALRGILGRAAGRTGLRRSATRAPGGRLYASRPGPLSRGWAFFPPVAS